MTFHLTQLLTGHGYFNRFLHEIGHAPLPGCSHCGSAELYSRGEDEVFYTIFHCKAFDRERDVLVRRIGGFAPGDFVDRMLEYGYVMMAQEVAEDERQALTQMAPSHGRDNRGKRAVNYGLYLVE